ncbi:MAG: ABC transporter ATP-binding protein, partial [Verrucomicrobiota bacterium]
MSQAVIQVEGLGKRYFLSHQAGSRQRYHALRDTLTLGPRRIWDGARALLRLRPAAAAGQREEFWALRDVSFTVMPGEVVGVIGRNGAGKSTLLKILSRITEPTTGRVTLNGRVASLLEVGTGFHPELSGRENIFLNGAILGIRRAEIVKAFDEIVAFAGVEQFIDTPVKHYSSGMYVRLAFAVAAQLQSEILIVDEVLAVGDLQFQRKCLATMQTVAQSGRSVLFVSHNLPSILTLCSTGLLLENGQVRLRSSVTEVVSAYQQGLKTKHVAAGTNLSRPRIVSAELDPAALTTDRVHLKIEVAAVASIAQPILGMVVYTSWGMPVFGTNMKQHPPVPPVGDRPRGTFLLETQPLRLRPGQYTISLWLNDSTENLEHLPHVIAFEV